MALPAEDTGSTFVWGANGAQLTPEQIANRRKIADALMAQGTDAGPLPAGTRGAGVYTQGLARLAKGVSAGLDYRDADRAEQANAEANKQLIASLLGGGGASSSVSSTPTVGSAPASLASAPASPDTSGKIYSNDEPSPLDPPSGQDRTRMIATILGEAGNEPQLGKNAVASVIRTRAVDGGYGGDTPSGVVTAPNQFEPWNTAEGRARMASAAANPQLAAQADAAIRSAYGEGGKAPEDPTEGMTHFYSPAGQAALGRPAPAWAGGESVTIGGHVFNSPDDAPGKAVQVASADPGALPANAVPTQGYAIPGQGAPAVAKVSGAMSGVNPAVIAAMTSPYASDSTKKIAGLILAQQLSQEKKAPIAVKAGETLIDPKTFQPVFSSPKDEANDSTNIKDYKYYLASLPAGTAPIPFDAWSTAKARASATNISNNVDMNSGQTYDKVLAEGLGKAHGALANGVEDAQTRARDLAAMQGAVDAIQKNGGTTGGLGQQQILDLKKTINGGASALGIPTAFNENDLSDKEFLTKFNRSIAGAQAKGAVGSRVTNFELSNYLKANPGLDMSLTGNQRLIGIQSQIEQRNIAVGNAIRAATAGAISTGKKIDPVTVQKIITDYDAEHHVKDPITGQDLTQSYALPEFQQADQGTNAALAVGHETNINGIKIKRLN